MWFGCFFFFPLLLEVGGAGKPSALGLWDDTVGCKGSPVGFGEAGGGLALRVRPWPRRLLRSVKVFPFPPPPTSPAAHGGVQGGGGGGTGFFFKILQVWDNLQPAAPGALVGERAVGVVHGKMWGAPPRRPGVRGDAGPHLRVGVSRGSPEPCAWGRWCHSRPRRRGLVARGGVAMPGPTVRARGGVPEVSPPTAGTATGGRLRGPPPPLPAPRPLRLCLCSVLIDR